MTRTLFLLAAGLTATASLASIAAMPVEAQQPRTITQTADGKPIMLGTMVVSATPLPETR
jgi:hypothetical protein